MAQPLLIVDSKYKKSGEGNNGKYFNRRVKDQ